MVVMIIWRLFVLKFSADELKNIVEVATDNEDKLSKLLEIVGVAGLVDTLKNGEDLTVFAPNDAAFENLSDEVKKDLMDPDKKEETKKTILRHVVKKKVMAEDIEEGKTTTLDSEQPGEQLTVTNDGKNVKIKSSAGTANVIQADLKASNGVIHIVDDYF